MNERLQKFVVNLKWIIVFVCLSSFAQNSFQFWSIMVAAAILLIFNLFEYFSTKEYKAIGQLHPNSTEKDKQDALSSSTEDKFINEVLGYAATLKINPTLDLSNGVMTIIDYDAEKNMKIPICALIFPEANSKYGSDKYKAAVAMMKEQIDSYVEEHVVNTKEENDNDKN